MNLWLHRISTKIRNTDFMGSHWQTSKRAFSSHLFRVTEISILNWSSDNTYRFLCLLNIQTERRALGTGGRDSVSRCSSTTTFCPLFCYLLQKSWTWVSFQNDMNSNDTILFHEFRWYAALSERPQILLMDKWPCVSHTMFTPAKGTSKSNRTLHVNKKYISTYGFTMGPLHVS